MDTATENKEGWISRNFGTPWLEFFISFIIAKIVQVNFLPETGMIFLLPVTILVIHFTLGGIINKYEQRQIFKSNSGVPAWKKIVTAVVFIAAFAFMYAASATIVNDLFGNPPSTNSNIPAAGENSANGNNAQFLATTVEEGNKSLPVTIDAETRLDTLFAGADGKLRYKYTLVNIEANQIDSEAFKAELETQAINFYCTSPDTEELRDRNIAIMHQYFGSDGIYIASIEVSTGDCLG